MPDVIKTGLDSAKWNEDIIRRNLRERDYAFYNDDHNYNLSNGHVINYVDADGITHTSMAAGFLEDIIYRRVDFLEAMQLRKYIETDNLTRRVINNKAILFKVPPKIDIPKATPQRQDNFKKLLDDTNFFAIIREIQKLTELHYDVHVIPQVRDGKVCIDFILAQDAFVEQNELDPTKFEKFFYSVGVRENSMVAEEIINYIYWDATGKHSCEITMDGQIADGTIDIPSIFDGKKIIPIVCFRNYIPINTYWSPRRNYLVDKNINIDLRLTELNMMESWNLPQKVRIGVDRNYEGKIGLTFADQIERNDNGEAVGSIGYIRPDAPITEERELIDWRKQDVASSYGIAADNMKGSVYNSGWELYLSKSEIIEKNKEERVLYLQPLKKLLHYMMIAAEEIGMKFDDKEEISVNFGELVYTQSPEEVARTRQVNLILGITSPIQFLMEDDPDLDEEEAKVKLLKIKAENDLIKPVNPFEQQEEDTEE